MKKKSYIWIGILAIIGLIVFFSVQGSATNFPALEEFESEVEYYKTPTCGCCDIHSNHLSSRGNLDVQNKMVSDSELRTMKSDLGISQELWSCHTAIVGEYFVEGHIPLEAINKLVEEQPDIAGIAMPGMPSGSPGMPGPKRGDFIIYSVNHDGTHQEFMRI